MSVHDIHSLWFLHATKVSRVRKFLQSYRFHCKYISDSFVDRNSRFAKGTRKKEKVNNSTLIETYKSTLSLLLRSIKNLLSHMKSSSHVRLAKRKRILSLMKSCFSYTYDDSIFFGCENSVFLFSLNPCRPSVFPDVRISLWQRVFECLAEEESLKPCDDFLHPQVIQVGRWFIAIFATIGNLLALLVMLLSRRKVSNRKLLMCSLTFSSLCLGVYYLILASVDVHSTGEYGHYSIKWRHSFTCKMSGFLAVFSTELSVLTLDILTMERYYTISFPLRSQKWLTIKQTTAFLAISLLASLVFATLPLTGVSSYTEVSYCLPFDVSSLLSKSYVTFLLIFNSVSMFGIVFAYVKIYANINRAQAGSSNFHIAKKMTVIVLINFSCWTPIAVFSFLAIYGNGLVDIRTSNILLLFIYPINAITNSFLYYIITRQFYQDLKVAKGYCFRALCCSNSELVEWERPSSFRASLSRTTTMSSSRTSENNKRLHSSKEAFGRCGNTDTQWDKRNISRSGATEV